MITYAMSSYDGLSHFYIVKDPKTGLSAGVTSSRPSIILSTAPELFEEEIQDGLAKCARRWRELNTPKLVLTMRNQPRRPLINDLGELCID